jgi:uncharacterized RDD family membrane protein YckC
MDPYAPPATDSRVESAAAGGVERVGFWPRFGASAVDGLVVIVIAGLTARWLSGLFPHSFQAVLAHQKQVASAQVNGAMNPLMETAARFAISAPIIGSIYSLCEAIWGRALGKLLFGLRIATDQGTPAPIGRLFLRVGIKNLLTPVTLVVTVLAGVPIPNAINTPLTVAVMVGYLLILGKRRQAFHDRVASTIVVRNSDLVR